MAKLRSGKTKLAKEDFILAMERRPDDARYLHMASINLLKIQRFKAAEELLSVAVQRFPNFLDAYKNLALARGGFHNYKLMTQTFEQALALNPPVGAKAAFYVELGEIYEGPAAQPSKALENFKKALKYMAERNFLRDRIAAKVPVLEKRIERERLLREGKPVPPELMPEALNDSHGHDHGDGHNHGPTGPGMQRGLTPVPPQKAP